jgi:hypothetical protein
VEKGDESGRVEWRMRRKEIRKGRIEENRRGEKEFGGWGLGETENELSCLRV